MSQSLYDLSFKQFEAYFQCNASRPWHEWLIEPSLVAKQKGQPLTKENGPVLTTGKQGYVGILQHPHNKALTCVYKVSRTDDNLVQHEYNILKALEPLSQYCPHVHRAYGLIQFECNVHFEHDSPLECTPRSKKITRPMLLMQHVSHKHNLNQIIEDLQVKDDVAIHAFKQVCLALHLAHAFRFTHYDLHTENILMRPCNPNMQLLYLLDDHTAVLVPTLGYMVNLIDFGFAYCEQPHNTLTCTLVHTQQGFTSDRFDACSDLKLFFVSTAHDVQRQDHRRKMGEKLGNITRNVFGGMNLNWSSGWDNSKSVNPVQLVHELVKDYVRPSAFFSKSDLWFDTVQQLMQVPLRPLPYHDLERSCRGFVEEFSKFEERIASKTLLNCVLRILVKHVRTYRDAYVKEGEEAVWATLEIKKHFLEEYTELVHYHVPALDYDKMICCLLLMSHCIEGLFHDMMEKRHAEKERQNAIMRCRTPLEFYHLMDYNFPATSSNKPWSVKTQILVIDHPRRKSQTVQLTKEHVAVLERLGVATLRTQYLRNVYEALQIDDGA